MIWKQQSVKVYEEKTKNLIFGKEEMERNWNGIKKYIKPHKKEEKYEIRFGYKFWWNKEWNKLKRRAKRVYKKWRKGRESKNK